MNHTLTKTLSFPIGLTTSPTKAPDSWSLDNSSLINLTIKKKKIIINDMNNE